MAAAPEEGEALGRRSARCGGGPLGAARKEANDEDDASSRNEHDASSPAAAAQRRTRSSRFASSTENVRIELKSAID